MDARPPRVILSRKRFSRSSVPWLIVGIILLICVVGLFEVSPLLTHSLGSTPTFKPTVPVGSASSTPVALTTPSVPTPSVTPSSTPATPGVVVVSGSQGNWHLTVKGSPYQVKGVTYDSPPGGALAD